MGSQQKCVHFCIRGSLPRVPFSGILLFIVKGTGAGGRGDNSGGRASDPKAGCNIYIYILTRIRFPAAAEELFCFFSLPVSFQCMLSRDVLIAPVCNRTHQHLRAR